ncbi:4099_t:CDS:2, partial [Funneliformis geosporum]
LFQITFIHSIPLIEQKVAPLNEQEIVATLLPEKNIDFFNGKKTPLFEKDIVPFYCQDGSSAECCPFLARKFALEHHSRVATIVLVNRSRYRIELISASLESGHAEAYSSVTSRFLGGVKGFALYYMNDDTFTSFVISWSVPTIGSPIYEIHGPYLTEKYIITLESDYDNTVFRVIVTQKIYPLILPKEELLSSNPNLDAPNYAPPF